MRAWWRRWGSLAVLATALVFVTVVPLYRTGPPIRSDGVGYHLWTRALLEGDLFFRAYRGREGVNPADPVRGTNQNKFPPGVALVRFPVMAFLVDRSPGAPLISRGEHIACLVLGALACLAVGLCCVRSAELLGAPPWARHTALLTVTFGAGLFHYATYDASFSHIWSALGIAVLAWLGIRTVVLRRPHLPFLPIAGLCLLLILMRNTNLVALALMTPAWFAWRGREGSLTAASMRRDAMAVLVGVVFALSLQLGYNSAAHGRLVLSSYQGEPFLWDRPMVMDVLASYERGLFTWYPALAVVLATALLAPRTRPAGVWFALLLLTFAAMYGCWHSWPLGEGFGHRGFVELTPLAIVLFAVSLGELPGRWRLAAHTGTVVCTLIGLQLMLGYWRGTVPGKGTRPEIYWMHVTGKKSILRWVAPLWS
jgi:hypothetical protein